MRFQTRLAVSALSLCLAPFAFAQFEEGGGLCPDIDDSAALQLAIDQLQNGDTLVLQPTTYRLAQGVHVSGKSKIHIVGTSGQTTIQTVPLASCEVTSQTLGTLGRTLVVVDDCDGCTVSGIRFDGGSLPVIPLGIQYSSWATISGNHFTNVGNPQSDCFVEDHLPYALAALASIGNSDNVYDGNIVDDTKCRTRGLWIGALSTQQFEHRPVISWNTLGGIGATAIAVAAEGALVHHNQVTGTLSGSGILFASNTTIRASDGTVEHNTVSGCWGHGIQSDVPDGSLYTDNIVVRNNRCSRNQASGIYAVHASHWTIDSNLIEDNDFDFPAGPKGDGIVFQGASDNIVVGNRVRDTRPVGSRSQRYGINIAGDTQLPVSNILISGNTIGSNRYSGINVNATATGTVNGVSIQNNTVAATLPYKSLWLGEAAPCTVTNVSYANAGNDFTCGVPMSSCVQDGRATNCTP